jgi:two-component system, chemotaxis family, protein-glutamate methylesterase/glutaminase
MYVSPQVSGEDCGDVRQRTCLFSTFTRRLLPSANFVRASALQLAGGKIRSGGAHTFDIVIIGASAGGIEALKVLLHRLPRDFPLPIAIVLHRSAREDVLPRILARFSMLPVQCAQAGEPMQPGVVYVASSTRPLTIGPGHTFQPCTGEELQHTSAIDPLFQSAALVYGPGAIAVVLTGGGPNGVAGSRAVHERGGTVIVQDPEEATHSTMPLMSQEVAKYVLPLTRIADALAQLVATGRYDASRSHGLNSIATKTGS